MINDQRVRSVSTITFRLFCSRARPSSKRHNAHWMNPRSKKSDVCPSLGWSRSCRANQFGICEAIGSTVLKFTIFMILYGRTASKHGFFWLYEHDYKWLMVERDVGMIAIMYHEFMVEISRQRGTLFCGQVGCCDFNCPRLDTFRNGQC